MRKTQDDGGRKREFFRPVNAVSTGFPAKEKQPPAPAIYESTGTRGSREERVRQTRGRRPARYLAGEAAAACVNQFQLATRS